MGKFIDHRENSRVQWGRTCNGENNPDREDIRTGCLLRIADATEAMAKEHNRLLRDNEYLSRRHRELLAENQRMARRIASLRGVITRSKNILAAKVMRERVG